ncbi:MAG: helix-turn-helix transcriptional regulator, partial [Dehalococcoidia bacterium]
SPEPIAFLQLIDGMVDNRTGDRLRSHEQIAAAIAQFEQVDPATVVWYAGWLPLVGLALGKTEEAAEHLRAQERRIAVLPEASLPARSARNLLALAYARIGDRERGAACEAALRPYAADYHWSPVRRSLAALAALRGDYTTALTDLAAAEMQARREEMQPDLGLILLQRAALLAGSAGDRCREEGDQVLRALGMDGTLTVSPAAMTEPGLTAQLTPRETDVLRLLVQGKSNRQIADALVISERTAINHVSHILAKLDVEHRSGAVAYALRHGIV